MQDILQSNPEFEVLLSNADQHITGALVALNDAGLDVESMYISGGGASEVAIDGIRAGTWDASIIGMPVTEGRLAAENVIAELRGRAVPPGERHQCAQPAGRPRRDGGGPRRQPGLVRPNGTG